MLLEGRGSVACLVSSVNPEENGKKKYCTVMKVWQSSNGTSYFKTKKREPKKQRCIFYSIREAKLPFISENMVLKKFEPGEKTESAICNLYPF